MSYMPDPDFSTSITVAAGKMSATFLVGVVAADEYEERDWTANRNHTLYAPVIRVTNHTSYDDFSPLVIRGRAYSVDVAEVWREWTETSRWERSHKTYTQGIRNDRGASVDWQSATRKSIEELVTEARRAFIGQRPHWQAESRYLRFRYAVKSEGDEIERARKSMVEHEAAQAKWLDRMNAEGKVFGA